MTRPETTRLVMKFGGTSMGDLERIRRAARIIAAEAAKGKQIAVVVSAMAGKTNELVGWVNESDRHYDPREYDAVVASGEQVTSGLLAIVLQQMGFAARSWQGWQIPISTDDAHGTARILDIDGKAPSKKSLAEMSMRDRNALRQEMSRVDAGIDTSVETECDGCGTKIRTRLEAEPAFLFPGVRL